MALFGRLFRDAKLFQHLNRELMGNIITQQVAIYKYDLEKSEVNLYGETIGKKFLKTPVLINCLIDRKDEEYPNTDYAIEFTRTVTYKFLKDDLIDANLTVELGDIILYQESYYEVDKVISNQLLAGKDPDYPNYDSTGTNPLNPGLENFGWDISVIAETHIVPNNKIGLLNFR
jgi:hypothetical protein